MQCYESVVLRDFRGNKSYIVSIQIGAQEPGHCDLSDNRSSSTVPGSLLYDPWNFLSVDRVKVPFCYVNKMTFAPHPQR